MAAKGPSAKRLLRGASQLRYYSAPADRSVPAAKQKYVPTSGSYPKGFLAGSAFAGVKASNTKYDDLALVASETPCPAAAVFTQNLFKAAPVQFSKTLFRHKLNSGFRGVIINSGCANAVTGVQGLEHAEIMARATDNEFESGDNSEKPSTMVMSTGVIGQKLPIDKITGAIPTLKSNLGNTHEHWLNAANAICTTDTFPKLLSRQFTLPSHPDTTYSIAGMTKGAGMIHPNMATLLAIVCTDAKIDADSMSQLLRYTVGDSFNSISIDGDTSTNDTLALFANGAAAPENAATIAYAPRERSPFDRGNRRNIDKRPYRQEKSEDLLAFEAVLSDFLKDLAKLVVRDGEGATKFVTIRVKSSVSKITAKRAAVSIARSALVKTALYGKDANWGRILCAIGYAPGIMSSREVSTKDLLTGMMARTKTDNPYDRIPQVVPGMTSVSFIPTDGSEELKLLVRGEPQDVDEVRAKEILEMEDLEIFVRLEDHDGPSTDKNGRTVLIHEAVFWTCDFSHEYVTINGDYRT